MTKFQYNNYVYSLTQQPSFLLNTGKLPQMGFKPHKHEFKLESVSKFMERMKFMLEKARFTIQKSQDNIVKYYNRHCTPTLVFKHSDKVLLDSLNIYTTYLSAKLSYYHLRPYIVEKQVEPMSYYLKLSSLL